MANIAFYTFGKYLKHEFVNVELMPVALSSCCTSLYSHKQGRKCLFQSTLIHRDLYRILGSSLIWSLKIDIGIILKLYNFFLIVSEDESLSFVLSLSGLACSYSLPIFLLHCWSFHFQFVWVHMPRKISLWSVIELEIFPSSLSFRLCLGFFYAENFILWNWTYNLFFSFTVLDLQPQWEKLSLLDDE